MQKLFILMMLSLTFMACDRQDKPRNSDRSQNSVTEQNNDNTGKNVRDRDATTLTPLDQSENEADRTITQKIRQAIVADDSLSTDAKNIKIITIKGVVTLRGPVASSQEKDAIARKASDVRGIVKVDNQLEIARKNY